MISTLKNQDEELNYINITKQDIFESITLEDVKNFLESLGVSKIVVNENKNYIVCPTICHNPIESAESMKLYWYQDHKIFRCYTECDESMTIFKLYQKFIKVNENKEVSEEEAIRYVAKCLNHLIQEQTPIEKKIDIDFEKYQFDKNIPQLPAYSSALLGCFTHYYHPLWLKDGIKKEVMDKFKISFSISQNKIIIPHFDIDGRLVGIRGRALNEEDIALGKYRPIQIGTTTYSHQLQFNLYGIYEHKKGIIARRQAIIAEGEKSVMLDDGYYGEFSNCVACCGSTFNKYQISMLTDILGANEIIVALDKEYDDWRSPRAKKYREKIEKMCRRYTNQASFSYIWDYDNLLNEKDSPFDRGKEVFEKLYKSRIKIR